MEMMTGLEGSQKHKYIPHQVLWRSGKPSACPARNGDDEEYDV
jgi:hypothetical protein